MTASLTRRYGIILASVGLLLVVDQVVLQPRLADLSVYAPRINIAGRQRMLSQKLVKASLALQAATDPSARDSRRQELRDTLSLWQTSHHALLEGNEVVGLPPTLSPDIRASFAELEPHFAAMVEAAGVLMDEPTADQATATQGEVMLDHESQYLPTMDRIVGMYEAEARRQARILRVLGLVASASIIALMIALGRLVLRPATQTIRRQMESLEDRVTERTKELEQEVLVRQQAEERTRELSVQLAHTSRVMSMGQLAVGLAHEINQPLGAIANYAGTCEVYLDEGDCSPETIRPLIENIGKAANRAGDIVRGMRNFLRPGQSPSSKVDMNQLVAEVLQFCKPELQRGRVTVHLLSSDEPHLLEVAPTQIQQVLVNLLQNALQAMDGCAANQREIWIRISDEANPVTPTQVRVEVEDSGPGFGDKDPETIFEPFFTSKENGLGMGLAIARTIIDEHHGRLWAENREHGAAVCLSLPTEQKHDASVTADSDCVCR